MNEEDKTLQIHKPTARLAVKFAMLNTWMSNVELETDPDFIRQIILDAFPKLKAFNEHIRKVEGEVKKELIHELNELEALIKSMD